MEWTKPHRQNVKWKKSDTRGHNLGFPLYVAQKKTELLFRHRYTCVKTVLQKARILTRLIDKVLKIYLKNNHTGISMVAQWLGIGLPTQGTRVRALVQEDPTCHGATKPVRHNYWACTLEPMLCNKRSHRSEKPMHRTGSLLLCGLSLVALANAAKNK